MLRQCPVQHWSADAADDSDLEFEARHQGFEDVWDSNVRLSFGSTAKPCSALHIISGSAQPLAAAPENSKQVAASGHPRIFQASGCKWRLEMNAGEYHPVRGRPILASPRCRRGAMRRHNASSGVMLSVGTAS